MYPALNLVEKSVILAQPFAASFIHIKEEQLNTLALSIPSCAFNLLSII
jgi:hypothetical protein